MKKKKVIKKILNIFFTLAIFGILYSFFFTSYENIKINKMINNFKNRSLIFYENTNLEPVESVVTINNQTIIRRFRIVPRETSQELATANVFYNDNYNNIGIEGDIFVTQQSPFPNIFLFHQFMSFYYGGHAAIKAGPSSYYEATGYPEDAKELFQTIFHNGKDPHSLSPIAAINNTEYWYNPVKNNEYGYNEFYRTKVIGLRINNPFLNDEKSEEKYNNVINNALTNAQQKIDNDSLYNFLFFLNMRYKYYCTDFVSRVYEEALTNVINNSTDYVSKGYAKRLNDDGFITSVNDLILSKDTFIHFYIEVTYETRLINGVETKLPVQNIYYLENIDKGE